MADYSYVVPPVTIDDEALTDSTVAEPDVSRGEAEYDDDHAYAFGDQAISTATHRVYRSLQDGNTGKPLPVAPATATEWWRDVGPTNKWAVFALFSTAKPIGVSPLTIKLDPSGRVTTLGATGVEADTVSAIMRVDGDEVWASGVINLRRRVVRTWYEWLITPFESTPDVLIMNIPPLIGSELEVTFTRGGDSLVSVTQMVVGRQIAIGNPPLVDTPATSDIEDFSKVDRDDYGTLTRVVRRTVPTVTMTVQADRGIGRRLQDTREKLHAQPALWIGLEDLTDAYGAAMFIVGIFKRWTMTLGAPDLITQEIEVEGL